MKSKMLIAVGMTLLAFGISKFAVAGEKATAQEVVEKVREAANVLSQSGEDGLAQFDQKNGPWVWKDTYIFVFDCPKGTIAAHPMRPDLIGKNARSLKGAKGTEFFPKLCEQQQIVPGFGLSTGGRSPARRKPPVRSVMPLRPATHPISWEPVFMTTKQASPTWKR